ncbi:TadE/TadG family type IV pilus assembly protein [Pelotomaculum propionicicum]|uniref:Putative Flp pilus-assembly TadG-like N-terminal domain-containing protein n=1 Tax=Pelotomaculum propionicicum TaxID=258475 RepID=A0A4Y7RQ22_9FIRM|nr:TadE/TadG family type IV pilus assembly protein [Pelotomaculum propionicicum]TEB10943.1 hypothetical protein Pmgp_01958 [Pelotomaculum propionicicum]
MKTIINLLKELKNNQRGSSMVIVAISLVSLIGFAALVIDIGMLTLDKWRLTNAIDAAALAGVQELPTSPTRAREVASTYALSNGCDNAVSTIQSDNGHANCKIVVTASRPVNFFFARILGFGSSTVSARAVAKVAGLTSFVGAAPLAVPNQTFNFNTLYVLKQGSNSPNPPPLGSGNYGALSLGGTGARNYEDNLKYGYDGLLAVGNEVDTETGNMSNPTLRAIEYRMSQCTHSPPCTPSSFDPGCKRILIVPVYDPVVIDQGQVKRIRVVGFAAFLVVSVSGQGNENYIDGYFIRMVANGGTSNYQTDYGLNGASLIE